ncbi:hypothetical protein MAUB1S_04743 [Mycolicibacterium aubagnense]
MYSTHYVWNGSGDSGYPLIRQWHSGDCTDLADEHHRSDPGDVADQNGA